MWKSKNNSMENLRDLINYKKESENNIYMKKTLEDLRNDSMNGGEEMNWLSPWKPGYIFHISRRDNNVDSEEYSDSYYIIEILILDSFYTKISIISLTESGCMNLLEDIDYFISDKSDTANITFPFLQRIDGTMPFLNLSRINPDVLGNTMLLDNNNPNDPYYDNKNQEIRNIKFSITLYSPQYQFMTRVLTIYLSESELCDFAYMIFFVGLIDIEGIEFEKSDSDKVLSDLFLNR